MTSTTASSTPTVQALFIGPTPRQPLHGVDQVVAVAGHGLEGDRKFLREGLPTGKNGPDRELTLIEAEAIEAVNRDYSVVLGAGRDPAQRGHAGHRAESSGRQAIPHRRGGPPGDPPLRAVRPPRVADAAGRARGAGSSRRVAGPDPRGRSDPGR